MTGLTGYLNELIEGNDLTFDQAGEVLDTIFQGDVAEAQIAAFLTAMRIKGTQPCELAGLAKSLRDHAVHIETKIDNLIDTCGTGGAAVKTFNISTAAAIVAAGAGAHVAKHGNRGITSKCGSADVLEALGVKIDAAPPIIAACIEQAGIGFMFAPMFHPAMKFVQPIRKSLGFRTVFNVLGPLANPAGAKAQVMGVPREDLIDTIIETHRILGARRVLVVHSDGLDEISTLGPTQIRQLRDGRVSSIELDPAELGISRASSDQLAGGDAAENAGTIRDIIQGRQKGPKKDIVLLNAAAAVIVAGLAEDFEHGIKLADKAIVSGRAAEALEKLIKISNS
ncbi:MAG: anthranilate phosphoribosyltransferase [Planctomycetota bacterium]